MEFIPLASSSSGNAYIVDDGTTRLLIECGVSYKKLLSLAGSTADLAGCLVSHEHKDHSRCVSDLLKNGIRCYMSQGTADALGITTADILSDRQLARVGSMDVVAFATYHDAEEPLGFLVRGSDGDILVFATDTVSLAYRFPGVTTMAVEANYDEYILSRHDKIPEKVRHRIQNTHMEIDTLCDYLSSLDLSRCRDIWLLHLSDGNSMEYEFEYKVRRAVGPGINVSTAPKEAKPWHNRA